jgi:aspartate carbamoyltransferase catalytic subunit
MKRLVSISDLDDTDIDCLLRRAREFESEALPITPPSHVGLLFLAPSLRTRVGFSTAAHRLNASTETVDRERDSAEMSNPESLEDTIRTLSGMVDVLVVRTPTALAQAAIEACVCPLINGGDGDREHPTQALIDLLAMEGERGPIDAVRVMMCGDLTMRAARSLLSLFARRPPASLRLVAPESRRAHGIALGALLSERTLVATLDDLADVDVLYLVGLPAGRGRAHISPGERADYTLDAARLEHLPRDAVVLSPLPVVDELDAVARRDPRVKMFEQSDRGVWLRMAVLEWAVSRR